MLRRLYLLFPRPEQALTAVTELQEMGVDKAHIHTLAREDVDISMLPPATLRQRSDMGARIEQGLWNLNLITFFVAMMAVIYGLFIASWQFVIPGCIVALVTFLVGSYVTRHIPRSHVNDFQENLGHGEVLMLVDVPRWRISEVEKAMKSHHPEMETGGVGWTIHALGI